MSFPPAAGVSIWRRVYRLEWDARFASVKTVLVSATRYCSSPIIAISMPQVIPYFTGKPFVRGAALMIDLKRC